MSAVVPPNVVILGSAPWARSNFITVTSPDTFEDQITVVDPEYLTGPWTWTYQYVRRKDYKINEYVCEDNRLYLDPATGQQKLRLGE